MKSSSIISNLNSFIVAITLLILAGCSSLVTQNIHLKYGNPSNANGNEQNYLIARPEYALSYNCNNGIANWVSWQLDRSWLGSTERSDHFMPNLELPKDCYAVRPSDYRGSDYDRGHLIPSGDRTHSTIDNESTFLMTNIIPQSPTNNREVWRELEEYSRELVDQGKELFLVAGGEGIAEKISQSRIVVPEYVWKVILILDDPGSEITAENARTLAVWMPNSEAVSHTDWEKYIVSVDQVESQTGYDFFAALPKNVQSQIEKTAF